MENRYGINILVSIPDFVCDLVYLDKTGLEKKAGKILSDLSGGMFWPDLAHICWWGRCLYLGTLQLPLTGWDTRALSSPHTQLTQRREAFRPGLVLDSRINILREIERGVG